MGLLFYLVAFWGLMYVYHQYLSPKRPRLRRRLRLLAAMIRDRLRWDMDILKAQDQQRFLDWQERYASCDRAKASLEEMEKLLNDGYTALSLPYPKLPSWATYIKESVELLVVVFGVVAGLRALFLQPFKIPTGSMQPTLYGIHFIHNRETEVPSAPKRALDYANYSRRYVDETAASTGVIAMGELKRRNPYLLFPTTSFSHDQKSYTFPGAPANVVQYLPWPRDPEIGRPNEFMPIEEGQNLASGYLMLGDHLFVDRVSYNFREPRRGDIVVFVTDNLRTVDRRRLSGRYFIKRLVGLPGDTLRLSNRKLYVKRPGESEFTVVDEKMHPAFGRLYSGKGGYRGYVHPKREYGAQYLLTPIDTFTLEDDQYFMMGDNSANSQDSRYWGPVPRSSIVGRAFLVWWPFTRRWGWVDTAEPEAYTTAGILP